MHPLIAQPPHFNNPPTPPRTRRSSLRRSGWGWGGLGQCWRGMFQSVIKQCSCMMETVRSSSVDFPRRKIYLSNLNQLIQKKVTIQPEVEVANKLFPHRNFAKKLSISHQRVRSSLQLRSQKFDLHWTPKQAKHMVVENIRPSHHFPGPLPRTFSTQLPATAPPQDRMYSSQSVWTGSDRNAFSGGGNLVSQSIQRPESQTRSFLRKGSNLQKQIVINLLRNKLLKEREMNEKKEYSNHEIIKMIQVFKGVALQETSKRSSPPSRAQQRRVEPHREIRGWEQEPLPDYDEHEEKE